MVAVTTIMGTESSSPPQPEFPAGCVLAGNSLLARKSPLLAPIVSCRALCGRDPVHLKEYDLVLALCINPVAGAGPL